MRQVSLHQSVFRLVFGLVLLTSITILTHLWWATHQIVQQRMSANTQLAKTSVSNAIASKRQLLTATLSSLKQKPALSEALSQAAGADAIKGLLGDQTLLDIDLISLVDNSGRLEGDKFASTFNGATIPSLLVEQAREQGSITDFVVLNNSLYLIGLFTDERLEQPNLALLGVHITSQSIKQILGGSQWTINLRAQMVTQSTVKDLSETSKPESLVQTAIISTSNKMPVQGAFSSLVSDIQSFAWYELIYTPDQNVSDTTFLVDKAHVTVELELVQSLAQLTSDFKSLKADISVIILIVMSISFVIALLYSRKLTKPIRYLAHIANNISLGNYHQKLDVTSNSKEFTFLANALDIMQSNIKEREKQITYQAEHDPLTKLYSRYHASVVIDERLKAGESFQAVCINIVGFRDINDVFGYQFGDHCLTVIASRLQLIGGLSATFGGGTFLWISRKDLLMLEIEELKHSIEQLIFDENASCTLKVSLAIVDCPKYASDSAELFKRLNIVLDEAKTAKVPWLTFNPRIEKKYTRRLSIVTQLRRNLSNRGENFTLFYQPKLNIKNQKVEAVEALIRWDDPVLGFVSPEEFIQMAEHAGLIGQVTMWVIKRAIRDAKTLSKKGLKVCIAINLSARDLVNSSFLPIIIDDLRRAGLSSSALSFEITESDLVKDTESAVWHLKEFKRAGFELAIDDFGTGYSSMAYLKSFPVDYLKIDKSFVLNLADDQNDRDIVETTLQLAQKFGLKVIAEGVENQQSLDILSVGGCDYVQGYFVNRPLSLRQFIEWNKEVRGKQWVAEQSIQDSSDPQQQGIEQLY